MGNELESVVSIPWLRAPASDGARVNIEQLCKVSLPDTGEAMPHLLKQATTIRRGASHELIESIPDDVPYPLDANQRRLEPVEILWSSGHRIVDVHHGGVEGCFLLVAEVSRLELGLQCSESSADLGESLLGRSIDLGVSGHLGEGRLESGLDALNLGIDLKQPA